MQTNRLEYIDRLKGFAILCVVLGHYAILALKQIDIVGEIIGSFHMPLFMFLSGYVISSAPTFKKCCKKVVPFMLPMILVGLAYVVFSGGTINAWLKSPYKFGYWYLYVLSVNYFLLFLIGKLGGANGVLSKK